MICLKKVQIDISDGGLLYFKRVLNFTVM